MNTDIFTICLICESQSTAKYCSQACEIGKENLNNLQKEISNLKQSEDRRVFFYDHAMSELCDMYTITMLKYAHEKNMKRQQYFAKNAEKLLKSIITKINRRHITKELLEAYTNLIKQLYQANARMWNARTLANKEHNLSWEDKADHAMQYFVYDNARNKLKEEIDIYADGISFIEKNYE